MKKLILILIITAVFPVQAAAKYYEIRTSYFNIIYDKNLETKAVEFSKKADSVADKIFKFYKFDSKKRYNIFLRDNSDVENCYTMYDTIILYPMQ